MRRTRPTLPLAALLAALAIAPTAGTGRALAADKPVEVENVRLGFNDRYKVGAWTPVWVQVRGGNELFEGTMEVLSEDESGLTTSYPTVVRIAPGETTQVSGYTRVGSISSDLAVRFRDRGGRVRATFPLGGGPSNKSFQPIFPDEILVVGLGRPMGLEVLATIPGLNGAKVTSGNPAAQAASVVEAVRVSGADLKFLPGRSMGFDAIDALVVDTNDRQAMAALADKGEQLQDWVERGGHLVVAVGNSWQMLRDHPIGRMLPASVAGPGTIKGTSAIMSFAGSTTPLQPPDAPPLAVARLGEVDARGSKALSMAADLPIIVRGSFGFGRVTVVAFDVDQAPFSTWADRGLFWVRALDLRPLSNVGQGSQVGRFIYSGFSDLAGELRAVLDQFPGVKLVPFGWVAFFIFLYILLIGPGDYLFLRKVVKRMELTWITFPAIVLIVSGVAYWAAYKIKGTELRVNQIDVVDVDIASRLMRGSAFVNVFSPRNHDYDVAVTPRPLREGGRPPGEPDVRVSWFGAPEFGPRGMNGGGRGMNFGSTGYRYGPPGSPDHLEGVRIPIWSSKAFQARWTARAEGAPIIDSELSASGSDRIVGTITNRLDVPLRNVILAYNSQVYYRLTESRTIRPGETVRVELNPPRNFSTYLGELATPPENNWQRTVSADPETRYHLVQRILFHDMLATSPLPTPSRTLHDLDLTGLLRLDRPILLAEIDRPLSDLNLGSGASPTQVSRTTVLRVVLPVENPHTRKEKGNPR